MLTTSFMLNAMIRGDLELLDIYSFTVIGPDEPYGVINTFSSIEDAIAFSIAKYDASEDHFVGNGKIQEEYLNYLK